MGVGKSYDGLCSPVVSVYRYRPLSDADMIPIGKSVNPWPERRYAVFQFNVQSKISYVYLVEHLPFTANVGR
jgi:hypothetical protein